MALFNIFREPRREITESAVGTVALAGIAGMYMLAGWWFIASLGWPENGKDWAAACFVTFLALVLATVVVAVILFGGHALGEGICNALANRGVELRPLDRH